MLTEGGAYAFKRMQVGATATGNGNSMTPLTVNGGSYALLTAQVVGITSATITWEGTIDEENWVALPALNVATRAISTTATADGIYRLVVTSLVAVRARISTYGSGTIYVYGLLTASGEPGFGATGGGVTDHASLDNLDFASAGHTGFEEEGTAAAAIVTHVGLADPHTQYLLESGYTAADVLTKLLTVDGAGSGLDADLLDGNSSAAFLLATGATTGATSSAQAFTNGIVAPSMRPASDSTTALQWQNAAGAAFVTGDTTNGRVGVGGTPSLQIEVFKDSNNATMGGVVASSVGDNRLTISGRRSRGTLASKSAVQANDTLFSLSASGYDGANDIYASRIDMYVDGAVSSNTVPQRISFVTGTNSGDRAERMVVKATGYIGVNNASPTALLDIAASTTARASLRQRAGTAPTAPEDGDMWNDGNAYAVRVNGTNAVNTDGGLSIWMQSSTTARNVGRVLWQYTDKTDATRASRGSVTAFYTTTEHKPVTWGANSGGALLSFYDVTTPIARQVLATGAGASVDDVITALQALGLVKQS